MIFGLEGPRIISKTADMAQALNDWLLAAKDYAQDPVILLNAGAIFVILVLGYVLSIAFKRIIFRRFATAPLKWVRDTLAPVCASLVQPTLFVLLTALVASTFFNRGIDVVLLAPVFSLGMAWFLLTALNCITKEIFWRRLVGTFIILVTVMEIFGLLHPTLEMLGSIGFHVGEVDFNLLGLIKGVVTVGFLLWMSIWLSKLADSQLHRMPNISPSLEVLFSKIIKIGLISISILIGLTTVGIDLSSLAILGGAVGLGLGFGLQKVISNLISGVILLLDKSIKPGDVISLNQTYGWINKLSARYVSVITRDGLEHLIPNEDLITNRVENWSFSDPKIRLRAPIGVSYDCDLRKAQELCLEAAMACPRVLNDPAPRCHVRGFGDNWVDLELRFWIPDPSKGVTNIKSMVYLEIWDRFLQHGIEIPFPQRDLHLRSGRSIEVGPERNGGLETAQEE
ncbi:MAG: mechanosensitive ion channel [Opitutae bacterium]|nr:mechanosensitive ion channel [Opitutae bacterium]